MRKIKILIITLLFALVLSGCTAGVASERNLKRIRVGMTPDEVHALMGKPDDTENNEYFEFHTSEVFTQEELREFVNNIQWQN